MVLVTKVASGVHDDRGQGVWGSNQALSRTDGKTHVSCQDDGKEVGKSVCDGSGVEEDLGGLVRETVALLRRRCVTYHGEPPNLDICATLQELGDGKRFRSGITTVFVDTIDDELGFSLSQEIPALVGLVREVDEGPVTDDTKEAGEGSFNDEDP